jgi:hypothetical protein
MSAAVESLLIHTFSLLIEDEQGYDFCHQHFRDFFAALHIVNRIEASLAHAVEGKYTPPPEMAERALLPNISEMIGEYLGEYKNREKRDHETSLHKLLDNLRGQSGEACGYVVHNVIDIWKRARNDLIVGEALVELDLTRTVLQGIVFSNQSHVTSFAGSRISETTFLPQGHSGPVNTAAYSPDGGRIVTASWDYTAREWDAHSGVQLLVFEHFPLSIAGCTFTNAVFTTPRIEAIVKAYSGKSFTQ